MAKSRVLSATATVVVIAAVIVEPALWWLYATFQRDRTSEKHKELEQTVKSLRRPGPIRCSSAQVSVLSTVYATNLTGAPPECLVHRVRRPASI